MTSITKSQLTTLTNQAKEFAIKQNLNPETDTFYAIVQRKDEYCLGRVDDIIPQYLQDALVAAASGGSNMDGLSQIWFWDTETLEPLMEIKSLRNYIDKF